MNFGELALYLDQLEATNSRNELVRILSSCTGLAPLMRSSPHISVQGRLAPFFAPVEMGLGEGCSSSAIAMAYETPKDEVSTSYRQVGDLGLMAQRLAQQERA